MCVALGCRYADFKRPLREAAELESRKYVHDLVAPAVGTGQSHRLGGRDPGPHALRSLG
jgi:hypothetical protein